MKKSILKAFIMAAIAIFVGQVVTAQQSVSDYDGNAYKAVKIGDNIWMAENLKAIHTYDGVELESFVAKDGYKTEYGRYYSFEVAKKMCPNGWRLPTDAEWKELEQHFTSASDFQKGGASGLDLSLAGWRGVDPAEFSGMDIFGFYWSATEAGETQAWGRQVMKGRADFIRTFNSKASANSVRCIKD